MGGLGAAAKEQAERVVETRHTLSTQVSALSPNPQDPISLLLNHGLNPDFLHFYECW